MLISLTTLLATLSSIFHSRAARDLENLALRHQIGVLRGPQENAKTDLRGPTVVALSVAPLA
jgi:hypothetical protein